MFDLKCEYLKSLPLNLILKRSGPYASLLTTYILSVFGFEYISETSCSKIWVNIKMKIFHKNKYPPQSHCTSDVDLFSIKMVGW